MMVADTFDEIERLESLLSRHRVGTPIWSLNETGVVRAPPREVLEVVQKGLDYSALTAGAFDMTIAPLDLRTFWSFVTIIPSIPSRRSRSSIPSAGPSTRTAVDKASAAIADGATTETPLVCAGDAPVRGSMIWWRLMSGVRYCI